MQTNRRRRACVFFVKEIETFSVSFSLYGIRKLFIDAEVLVIFANKIENIEDEQFWIFVVTMELDWVWFCVRLIAVEPTLFVYLPMFLLFNILGKNVSNFRFVLNPFIYCSYQRSSSKANTAIFKSLPMLNIHLSVT